MAADKPDTRQPEPATAKDEGVAGADLEPRGQRLAPTGEPVSQDDLTGSVQVVFTGISWTRNDPTTGKVARYRRGAKLNVTNAEYELLSKGPKPTVRKATKDD